MLHLLYCYVFYPIFCLRYTVRYPEKQDVRNSVILGSRISRKSGTPPPPFTGLNCSMEKAATVRFKTYILYTGSVLTFK